MIGESRKKKKVKHKLPNPAKVLPTTRGGVPVSGVKATKDKHYNPVIMGWLTINGQNLPHVWNKWGQDRQDFNLDLVFKK